MTTDPESHMWIKKSLERKHGNKIHPKTLQFKKLWK